MPIQLIVGLGNPGAEYVHTRHNAGIWFVEQLLQNTEVSLRHESKFHGTTARIKLFDQDVHILIPSIYMNESGLSVLSFAHFYKILPPDILIAHDDLALPVSNARLKQGGGHGGHNGLRDVISRLHSQDFWRIRIGIDHPGHKDDVSDYVLHRPNKIDKNKIDDAITRAANVMPDFLSGNVDKAIQNLHTKEEE